MVFEHIEKLKQEYTDKYVVVDEERPELRRFRGQTGIVKTVNMSGRALVEFDANLNIGWYDIEIDYLKVVDKPAPKVPEKKAPAKKAPAKKPAAKPGKPADKKLSTSDVLAAARGGKASDKPAAKPAADPTKMSVADVLAAARGNAPAKADKPAAKAPAKAGTSTSAKQDPKSMSVQDMLAAARAEKSGGAPAAEAKPRRATPAAEPKAEATPSSAKKTIETPDMTVEQMLAAARAEKRGGGSATTPQPKAATPAKEPESKQAEVREDAQPPAPEPAAAKDSSDGPLPTETAEIVAWCRERDAQ